jgi:uncharacterized protein (DUF488 family)
MIPRQQVLISFIDNAGGRASRLELVKWAFLYAHLKHSPSSRDFYQFVPYRFGPFSFTLYHELDSLIRDGILESTSETTVALTESSKTHLPTIDRAISFETGRLWEKLASFNTAELLTLVYNQYPWFTFNADYTQKRAMALPRVASAVYTAGFGGQQVDGFLNLLLQNGIRAVIDVRSNPVSRKYGFHKGSLSRLCSLLRISYHHFPELGVPSQWRIDLHDDRDYERLFARYEADVLSNRPSEIRAVMELMISKPTALACQEADAHYCHRSILANRIHLDSDLSVCHLGAESARGN